MRKNTSPTAAAATTITPPPIPKITGSVLLPAVPAGLPPEYVSNSAFWPTAKTVSSKQEAYLVVPSFKITWMNN